MGLYEKYGWKWQNYTIPIVYATEDIALFRYKRLYAGLGAGAGLQAKENKGYLCIKQDWKAGDRLTVTLPYGTRRIERVREYTHETRWGFNAWAYRRP